MPRSSPSGIAAVYGGLLLLSSCAKEEHVAPLGRPPAKGPLTVTVTCDNDVTVGLTDAAKNQAWAFEAKGNDAVEWQGSAMVTSIVVEPKTLTNPLPLEGTPTGNGKDHPAKSKVKGGAAAGIYAYKITVTCQPTDTNKVPIKVTIDPDMIIY